MKLPNALMVIEREGRTDSYRSVSGIEPMWFKSTWRKVKKVAKVVKPFACAACNFIPHPAAKVACMIAC